MSDEVEQSTSAPAAKLSESTERWWIKPGLAYAMLAIFGASTFGSFWLKDQTVLNSMLETVKSLTVLAFGYYLGSSSGSAKKTDFLAAAPPISTGGEK